MPSFDGWDLDVLGTDNADDTNTVLDDRIDVVRDGVLLRATAKMRYLAWRGLADATGVFVDDFGNLIVRRI